MVLGSNAAFLNHCATWCKSAFPGQGVWIWGILPSCSPDLVIGRMRRACLNSTLRIGGPMRFFSFQLACVFPWFLVGRAAGFRLLCDEQPLAAAFHLTAASLVRSWGSCRTQGARMVCRALTLDAAGLSQGAHLAHTPLSCSPSPSLLVHLLPRSFREPPGCGVKREEAYCVP